MPRSGAQPATRRRLDERDREGCIDITPLEPAAVAGEVFSYFERLPLPTLTTQHQPPGNGLSGLPVIFYTDSPTTQTFTVDIRGFTVVINAAAEQFTWHTGDRAPAGRHAPTRARLPRPDDRAPLPVGHLHRLPHRHLGRDVHRQRRRARRRPGHDDHRRPAGHLRRPPGPRRPDQPVRLNGSASRRLARRRRRAAAAPPRSGARRSAAPARPRPSRRPPRPPAPGKPRSRRRRRRRSPPRPARSRRPALRRLPERVGVVQRVVGDHDDLPVVAAPGSVFRMPSRLVCTVCASACTRPGSSTGPRSSAGR